MGREIYETRQEAYKYRSEPCKAGRARKWVGGVEMRWGRRGMARPFLVSSFAKRSSNSTGV